MSESDTDDIEEIRERKRREIVEKATGEASIEPTSDDAGGSAGAPDEPIHVEGPEHFEEVTGKYDVVLVDYYADWCGPCQMLEPIVAEVARETPAAVAKVDIDRHQTLAQRGGVRGVPTLLLYADGEPVERMVGVQDQGTLMDLIERYGA